MSLDELEFVNTFRTKQKLEDRQRLMDYLQRFTYLTTGRADVMFCNAFISESIKLLINSIDLYEDGYFDCAFYSVRQAVECTNNMLFLVNSSKDTLKSWNLKEYFPPDNKIKDKLQKFDDSYKEVYSVIPYFFDKYEELQKKANKTIHKQGFDVFYSFREINKKKESSSEGFFTEFLIYAIARTIIMYIILDPLSLALCDKRLKKKIHFMPMTEPVDIEFFNEFLSEEIVDKIKETEYYHQVFEFFDAKEELNSATYDVLLNEIYDTQNLQSIEAQRHLLNAQEKFFLDVLQHDIKVQRFFNENSIYGYITSDYINKVKMSWKSGEYDCYKKEEPCFNMSKDGLFISSFTLYNEIWFFEHTTILNENDMDWLKHKISKSNNELKMLYEEINWDRFIGE
jgi:hypothetical protein